MREERRRRKRVESKLARAAERKLMAVPRLLHLCIIFYLCRVREDMGAARACLCALASVFLLFLSVQTELHPKTENLENILSEKKKKKKRRGKEKYGRIGPDRNWGSGWWSAHLLSQWFGLIGRMKSRQEDAAPVRFPKVITSWTFGQQNEAFSFL